MPGRLYFHGNPALKRTRVVRWVSVAAFFRPRRLARALGFIIKSEKFTPEPSVVNPHNFKVVEIIYNLNGFSVAWGIWEDDTYRLAMRWNGEGDDKGYPKTFGNPVWFMLPQELSLPILQSLGAYQGSHRAPTQAK